MKLIPLLVKALGPLAFPETKAGVQFRKSLPYVPGAAIYGALGMLLGSTWTGEQEDLMLLLRQIRCHNAYPVYHGDSWSRPLPMTAIQPKGGKDRDNNPRCPDRNGKPGDVRRPYDDSLYARVCWEQQQPTALIYAPSDAEGRPWENAERSFYTLLHEDCTPWRPGKSSLHATALGKREMSQRVLTRVAINRRRGIAEHSRLYSPFVLSEVTNKQDSLFRGSIVIPDDDTHILDAVTRITAVGGRQTSGIGSVQITEDSEVAQNIFPLTERVQRMSMHFAKQAQLYQSLGGTVWKNSDDHPLESPGTIFTVNLISDALLFEQGWLPTNEISATMLKEYTGIDAKLIRTFSTTTTVGGWNVVWQRPKQTAIATSMGSLFVFQVNGTLSDEHYQKLSDFEQHGIGERRSEGFGQIRICDEFHLLAPEEAL